MKTETFLNQYGGEFISSRSNPTVAAYGKLSEKKYREEARLFLAEGVKLAEEALLYGEAEALVFSEDVVKDGRPEVLALAEAASQKNARIIVAGAPAFDKLTSEKAPQGVIAVARHLSRHGSCEDLVAWQKNRRILILDHIQDPGNFGTILRSAAAFGFDGVLTVDCADLYHTKTLRASMGAVFRSDVRISRDPVSDIAILQNEGRRVLAAALGEVSLTLGEMTLRETDGIVIGNEGHGIAEEILATCNAAVRIPMASGSESLNAAAAAAIILWEYYSTFH